MLWFMCLSRRMAWGMKNNASRRIVCQPADGVNP